MWKEELKAHNNLLEEGYHPTLCPMWVCSKMMKKNYLKNTTPTTPGGNTTPTTPGGNTTPTTPGGNTTPTTHGG